MIARNEKQLVMIVLSLCPAAVASARVLDALCMAAGVVLVLAAMSFLLPLLRTSRSGDPVGDPSPRDISPAASPSGGLTPTVLPPAALSPSLIWGALLLSSCLTALFELALSALAPAVVSRLGIYVPLVAVSFLTVGRLDALSRQASPRRTALETARVGAAFTIVLVVVSVVREVLGSGTITLGSTIPVGPFFADPARAAGLAGGALICLGYAAGAVRLFARGAGRDDGEAG